MITDSPGRLEPSRAQTPDGGISTVVHNVQTAAFRASHPSMSAGHNPDRTG